MSSLPRRVVVTGLGMVTPLGNTVEDSWRALLAGESGAAPITRFDATEFSTRFAAEVKEFDVGEHLEPKQARRMDRCTHLLVAAAHEAAQDAGHDVRGEAERTGAAVGTALGGVGSFEDTVLSMAARGPGRVSPFAIVQTLPNLAAGWMSIELGTRGPLLAESTACAASAMAIGDAFDAIRLGRADVMFAGGTEAPVTPVAVAGFGAMRALSTRNDAPETASRPFDQARDGFVIAEAAAVLVLEELEHALARDASICAELVGYGTSSDANHVSDPDPVGSNAGRALQMALTDAGITPAELGYVNAHGTSPPAGDAAEVRALKVALGDEARTTAVSSTKGATGHTLGAAGAVEAIFTVRALQVGVLPATLNYEDGGDDWGIDLVRGEPRLEQVEFAASNSFGFGGHNTAVVFRRWDGS